MTNQNNKRISVFNLRRFSWTYALLIMKSTPGRFIQVELGSYSIGILNMT